MGKIYFKVISFRKKRVTQIFLLALLILVTVLSTKPTAVMVFNSYVENAGAKRKLPIYSVDTQEKKVSISFDAA